MAHERSDRTRSERATHISLRYALESPWGWRRQRRWNRRSGVAERGDRRSRRLVYERIFCNRTISAAIPADRSRLEHGGPELIRSIHLGSRDARLSTVRVTWIIPDTPRKYPARVSFFPTSTSITESLF